MSVISKKVLIYARVSTEKNQKPEVQLAPTRQFCNTRGWVIVEEIIDEGFSGGTDQRPGLKRLLSLVYSRQVDIVVVAKLDRLARSLRHLITLLDEFSALGIHFVSIGDQIDMSTASGRLMVHIIAAFAEFERALIRERTMAGLAHARAKGKRLGRPQIHAPDEICRLHASGLSYRAIAQRLGTPMGTITKALRTAHKSPPKAITKSATNSGIENE
jgi:DNA invertase Pin-like site-specific DNA recombinase